MLTKVFVKYNSMPLPMKAAMWFLFCSILQKCFSVITTPIFTRLLTTDQFGEFTIYISWLNIFAIFTSFRLDYAVFNKGMSKYRNGKDDYTASMQSITTILTLILFVIYLPLRNLV
ncbi:lipopolysaccharide biosynthesis protein [Neobacillus sp. Marseille-QA0830]